MERGATAGPVASAALCALAAAARAGGQADLLLGRQRVVLGHGTLERLGRLTAELGCRRVLLVTDTGVRAAGHAERALAALASGGLSAVCYDGVGENPTTGQVDEGAAIARAAAVDGIVACGGGSVMDCAKGVNFLVTNGGRMEDYRGEGRAERPLLPAVGVPTTAGTGSEAQSVALISQEGTHVKMACGDDKARFAVAVLDPALAVTAPSRVAGEAAIDAVSHAVESYVTTCRTAQSADLAREAWRLLRAALPAALATREDPVAWSSLLLGAHLAGAAIERSMLGAAHACANPLTARFGVSHGAAVGLMLPAVMRFNAAVVDPLYRELSAAAESDVAADQHCVELRAAAGLPERLRDVGVPRAALPVLAAEAARQWTAGFNPRPVGVAELEELYATAY